MVEALASLASLEVDAPYSTDPPSLTSAPPASTTDEPRFRAFSPSMLASGEKLHASSPQLLSNSRGSSSSSSPSPPSTPSSLPSQSSTSSPSSPPSSSPSSSPSPSSSSSSSSSTHSLLRVGIKPSAAKTLGRFPATPAPPPPSVPPSPLGRSASLTRLSSPSSSSDPSSSSSSTTISRVAPIVSSHSTPASSSSSSPSSTFNPPPFPPSWPTRYQEAVEDVLADKSVTVAFRNFLAMTYAEENLYFYLSALAFRSIARPERRLQEGLHLYDVFVKAGGLKELNCEGHQKECIRAQLFSETPEAPATLFDSVLQHILALIGTDSLPKFRKWCEQNPSSSPLSPSISPSHPSSDPNPSHPLNPSNLSNPSSSSSSMRRQKHSLSASPPPPLSHPALPKGLACPDPQAVDIRKGSVLSPLGLLGRAKKIGRSKSPSSSTKPRRHTSRQADSSKSPPPAPRLSGRDLQPTDGKEIQYC